MKKLLSIMICAAMLIGAMMSVVSAEVPDEGWLLSEYGQKTFAIDSVAEQAPFVDGEIDEGEYTLVIDDIYVANVATDDRIYLDGNPTDVEKIELYASVDSDYLYFALRFENKEFISNDFNYDGKLGERIALNYGFTERPASEVVNIFINYEEDGTIAKSQNAGLFDAYSLKIENNIVTFEWSIEIVDLMDKQGVDNIGDCMYFRAIVCSATNETAADFGWWGEVWFGFEVSADSPVLEKHNVKRLPHVLSLPDLEASVETDPVETDPVETDPVETDPVETDPVETDPVETDPVETDPVETDPVDTDKGGCGASVAAMGIALVATLGTCAVFVCKRKEN